MDAVFVEFFSILLSLTILVQNSVLWMSVLLVPLSFVIMLSSYNFYWAGGLTAYVFIMVFVGGLLILLVLVTSTSPQEESTFMRSTLFSILLTYFSVKIFPFSSEEGVLLSENVVAFSFNEEFLGLSLVLILIGLISISLFFMKYKGLMRSV